MSNLSQISFFIREVIVVIPSKSFLAMRIEVAKQKDRRKPRKPFVSTGVLLTSKTNFTFLNLKKGSVDVKPKIEMSGSVMMKSGFERIM